LALAVNLALADPLSQVGWAAGSVLAAALVTGVAAACFRSPPLVYLSGGLIQAVASLLWRGEAFARDDWLGLVQVNLVAAALASIGWSAVARFNGAVRPSRYPLAAVLLGLAALAGLSILGIERDLAGRALTVADAWTWAAFGLLALAALAAWVVRPESLSAAAMYFSTIVGAALGLDRIAGDSGRIAPTAALVLAGLVLATTLVALAWGRHGRLVRKVEPADRWLAPGWFLASQACLAFAATALATWTVLGDEVPLLSLRLLAPAATVLLAAAGCLLGRDTREHPRQACLMAFVLLGGFSCAQFGWALLPRDVPAPLLQRAAVLLTAAAATIAVSVALRPRWSTRPDWEPAMQRVLSLVGLAAAVTLGLMLWRDFATFERSVGNALEKPLVVVATASLVALIGALLAAALAPRFDPWRLGERGRQAYVYGALALGALTWLHLYLCIPKLLELGIMERYWTIVMLAVAFAGAGLAELFHRRQMPILGRPLTNTATCLPLVPVAGFWLVREWFPTYASKLDTPYWTLLALVSGLYAWLTYTRRSMLFAVLAVVAGNAALWRFLDESGFAFLEFPHLWLIPAALVVLAAEYLNRDRLQPAQSATLRYLCLSVVYVSTTFDIFRDGLRQSMPFGPLLLLGLSLAGMLAGMLLRVRSFLVLGTSFLGLFLVMMVYHATVDLSQEWVLYASGIAVGAAIFALFAVFEKRKHDITDAVHKLRQWER
jgi:hypothetical protein